MTTTRKIGSCPPKVHAALKRIAPNGFYGARDSRPRRRLEFAESIDQPTADSFPVDELATATLEALIADDAVPDAFKKIAQAALDARGDDDERGGPPSATVDPRDEEAEVALALSHVHEFSFVDFCERSANRA